MGTYIKAVCQDCATDPCRCTWGTPETFGNGPTTDNYDVTAYFASSHTVDIVFDITGCTGIELKADGVSIYSSGCPAPVGSKSATVPAGTLTLSVIITTCGCSPGDDGWRYEISCSS